MLLQPKQRILFAGDSIIAAGDAVRSVSKIEVAGVPVAEDAPMLGIALSEPHDGLVWVLVNPQ